MAKSKKKRRRRKTHSSTAKGPTVQISALTNGGKVIAIRKKTGKGPDGLPVIEGTVGGTKGDPLDFQLSAKVKVPKGRTVSARVLTEAIRYRCEKGRNPKGIQLRIIRWRNPARKKTNPNWRYTNDPDIIENTARMLGPRAARITPQQAAWVTLRQALEAIQVADISVGGGG